MNIRRKRSWALAAGVAAAFGGGCLHSNLTIPPGQQFELDGGQAEAYRARVQNVGGVPVDVLVRADGQVRAVEMVQPGDTTSERVNRRSTLVLRNASDEPAQLDVTVRGDTNLGMGYQDLPAPP